MISLVLCVLASVAIVIIFKFFERFEINNQLAITVNYFTAAVVGFIIKQNLHEMPSVPGKEWFFQALLLGVLFIFLFNILGLSTRKVGVSVSAVAFKMGLIIPVIAAGLLYPERNTFSFIKVTGIVLALVAVILSSVKKESADFKRSYLFLPAILFVGSGFCDAYLEFTKEHYLPHKDLELFSSSVFFIAASLGFLGVLIQVVNGKMKIDTKSIIAGLILGIPNFFSLYFMYKALDSNSLQSSVVFPVNNMGIVAFSAILGFLIFKERLTTTNWLGIGLAVISIAMITFG